MSIEGRIAIDVNFADSATSDGVQSLKKISLTDTTSYTTGKVAIVTGTVGTASQEIAISPTSYKDAAGNAISFVTVERVALLSSQHCSLEETDTQVELARSIGRVSIGDVPPPSGAQALSLLPEFTAGTASYTLVLYGT